MRAPIHRCEMLSGHCLKFSEMPGYMSQKKGSPGTLVPLMLYVCTNTELSLIFSFQLRDTDDDLGTGSRVLSVMIMRVQRSRIVLAGVAFTIIVIILVSIYLSFYG